MQNCMMVACVALLASCCAANVVVKNKVDDVYHPAPLGDIHITSGILADRMKLNLEGRLLNVDEAAILGGFEKRPGSHPWIGEHAGKFLHAAVKTWLYTHDQRIKDKLDRVAKELMKCQLPDGYLGTYSDDQRWTGWDVWVHKYDMIGLLAYYDATGDQQALEVSRKIGDLLSRTFGDGDYGAVQGKDISMAGEHMGMAATSVLEPMCYLYERTGEKKYLNFCLYITRAMDKSAHVLSSLTKTKKVYGTANNKAYEMLSNLLGLTELYRITGDEKFLTPALNAWQDIVAHRLYISGTTSSHEFFQPDNALPAGEDDDVGEGCVTVTWMQLNLSLLKLKGEVKYADQLERTIYNQLLSAQEKDNGDICYFTPLMGTKKPTHQINCCLSSEPRGISLIPEVAAGTMNGAVVINLLAPLEGKLGGADVRMKDAGPEEMSLTIRNGKGLYFRNPSWSPNSGMGEPDASGYLEQSLEGEKTFHIEAHPTLQKLDGGVSYPGCVALQYGPQVSCIDAIDHPEIKLPQIYIADIPDRPGTVTATVADVDPANHQFVHKQFQANLIPITDAASPRAWFVRDEKMLPSGDAPLTYGGTASQSRPGNLPNEGPINDLRPDTMQSTRNNHFSHEDWFAVEFAKPAKIGRVVYRHGMSRPDGGWFDTSDGKPRIEYKASKNSEWTKLGELSDYPEATSTSNAGITSGQPFELKLSAPVEAVAIRVIGTPASGNRPKKSFVTCAELEAYEK